MTEIPDLQASVAETEAWIDDFIRRMEWHDFSRAFAAFIGALHAIRDAIPRDEAVAIAGPMPALLRGLYFEGWRPSVRIPVSRRSFLERIHDAVHRDPGIDSEEVARAVLELLAARLPRAELEEARASTPSALRSLWPS